MTTSTERVRKHREAKAAKGLCELVVNLPAIMIQNLKEGSLKAGVSIHEHVANLIEKAS